MLRIAVLTAAALTLAACGQKTETAKSADAAGTAATATVATSSGPVTMPARKPGLWTQTVNTGDMTQTSKICIDATVDKAMSVMGSQMSKEMCSKNEITAAAGGYAFESVCQVGSGMGTTTSKGTVTGDFNSKYTVAAETTVSGANAAQMNGAHKMTLEATWTGPCPAGFQPGDMELPGGMKMNIAKMAGAAKGAN